MLKRVSKEVKEKFKKEHGAKLKSLQLPLDDNHETYQEVLAVVPTRSVVGQHLRFAKENPNKAQEILVKNCLLTSKEEVLADDALFYSAVGLISDLIPIREGKFGKL